MKISIYWNFYLIDYSFVIEYYLILITLEKGSYMKKYFKFGYLLIALTILVFTLIPQNESFALEKKYDENEILQDLDQETINMFEELDKYLIENEDGSIRLDKESAELDNVEPEILNLIDIINNMEEEVEKQGGEISTYDFAFPIGNYGRYCGKGNKGGTPIDDLDRACKTHDGCFLGFNNKSAKNKKCNRNFVRSLLPIIQANSELTKKGAYARAAVYLFKGNM